MDRKTLQPSPFKYTTWIIFISHTQNAENSPKKKEEKKKQNTKYQKYIIHKFQGMR